MRSWCKPRPTTSMDPPSNLPVASSWRSPCSMTSGNWDLDALLGACHAGARDGHPQHPAQPHGYDLPSRVHGCLGRTPRRHRHPGASATRSTGPSSTMAAPKFLTGPSQLRERGLAFGSFGKLLQVTGWKIGWAVGPAPLTAEFEKVHQYDVFSTGAPLQAALASFLPHPKVRLTSTDLRHVPSQTRPLAGGLQGHRVALHPRSKAGSSKSSMPATSSTATTATGPATGPAPTALPPFHSRAFHRRPHPMRLCFAKEDATLDAAVNAAATLQPTMRADPPHRRPSGQPSVARPRRQSAPLSTSLLPT